METTIDTGRDVWALVFLEDGKHLLSGGREAIIRQWRIEDGKEVQDQRLKASGHVQVTAIALSGDGNWIIGGGWGEVTVWNRKTRQSVSSSSFDHSSWVNEANVSPDSTRFATASDDYKVIIWNISNGKPLIPPLQHCNKVTSVRFSPDGNRVATASRDSELRIYDAHNGQFLSGIAVSLFPTNPIAWSNPQHIFALSSRSMLRNIHVDTRTLLSEWKIPGQPQSNNFGSIALSNNGRFIASFVGQSLTFWDACTHAQFGPVFNHPQTPRLYSMALSSDNNYLAMAGHGGIITLRNLTYLIPASHRVVELLQAEKELDLQSQIEALRGMLRTLEPRLDGLCSTTFEPIEGHVIPQRIPDGIYRVKSNTGDLCLTHLRDEAGSTVIVRPLDQSDVSQRWTVSLVTDGAYNILRDSDVSLTVGIGAALLTGPIGTTWTFEPRGAAYVIGNAANVLAIQLEPNYQNVSVLPRNNSAEQRWVLERVA